MRQQTIVDVVGNTIRLTWVSSGILPTGLCSNLFTGSETLVSSVGAVSSGNGFFFAAHLLPSTPGWFVNRWFGFISPGTYTKAQYVKAISPEVD